MSRKITTVLIALTFLPQNTTSAYALRPMAAANEERVQELQRLAGQVETYFDLMEPRLETTRGMLEDVMTGIMRGSYSISEKTEEVVNHIEDRLADMDKVLTFCQSVELNLLDISAERSDDFYSRSRDILLQIYESLLGWRRVIMYNDSLCRLLLDLIREDNDSDENIAKLEKLKHKINEVDGISLSVMRRLTLFLIKLRRSSRSMPPDTDHMTQTVLEQSFIRKAISIAA